MGTYITRALSMLESPTSLAGLGVKDTANVAGLTGMAYKTGGEHEAREKFIDETGTSVLWLLGIPACRKLFDMTVFKWAGLDPEVSIKKLPKSPVDKRPQVLDYNQLKSFSKETGAFAKLGGQALSDKYKALNIAKFAISTVLPSLLIVVLPKLNQRLTRKIITERAIEEEKKHHNPNHNTINTGVTTQAQQPANSTNAPLKTHAQNFFNNPSTGFAQQKTPAFKGLADAVFNTAATAQTNPVGNILLVDSVITGNRITYVPRNNQQRQENMIKEGGFIFFIFIAQDLMKKMFDKFASKSGTPVDLDFKTINLDKETNSPFLNKMKELHATAEELKKSKAGNKLSKEEIDSLIDPAVKYTNGSKLKPDEHESKGVINKVVNWLTSSFKKENRDHDFDRGVLDFLHDSTAHKSSVVVDVAKQTGILKEAEKGNLDPRKFIETKQVQELSENIRKFASAMIESGKSPEEFIQKARSLKAKFLVGGIAVCMTALGIVLPKIQYTFRKKVYGTTEYPGIKGYEEEAKKVATKAN
jgi:hypothetical protein